MLQLAAAAARRDPVLAAFGHDVGGAERPGQALPVFVTGHHDDPRGAQPFGGQHRAQPDRAVPDDHHRGARADVAGPGGVMASGQHV